MMHLEWITINAPCQIAVTDADNLEITWDDEIGIGTCEEGDLVVWAGAGSLVVVIKRGDQG